MVSRNKKKLKWIQFAAFIILFIGVMCSMVAFLNGYLLYTLAGLILVILGVLLLRYAMSH